MSSYRLPLVTTTIPGINLLRRETLLGFSACFISVAGSSFFNCPRPIVDASNKEGGQLMLWYCRFQWYPGVTREQVAKRILEEHKAGGNRRPEIVKGWYNLTGGGAGFLLLECNDPREVTAFLQPYMDILSWDVHAVYSLDYDQEIQRLQQVV